MQARSARLQIARPRPAPPARRRAVEGGRRGWPRARSGMPGPLSPTWMITASALAPGRDRDPRRPAARAGLAQRLHGVAHEVDEDARELVGIGVDLEELRRDFDLEGDAGARRERRSGRAARRRSARAGRGAAAAGARRPGRRRASPGRSRSPGRASRRGAARPAARPDRSTPSQAVGQELRGGQHVAQLVVDLADREAELGEAALLAQLVGEHGLHLRERLLGDADLVGRGRDGVMTREASSGCAAKAAMLPDSRRTGRTMQPMQREVNEARGDARDESERIRMLRENSSIASRSGVLIDDDLDEIGARHGLSEHPDRPLGRRQEQRTKASRISVGQVAVRRSTVRATSAGMSAAARSRRVPPPRTATAVRADACEKPGLELVRQAFGGRGVEHERGDLAPRRAGRSASCAGNSRPRARRSAPRPP